MASYVLDMTQGNEFKHLIKFSIPLFIGNIFQQFYSIVNSMVVGRQLGKNSLAAVGIVGTLHYMFFSLCFGLAVGIGIVISQYFGAKKEDQVKQAIGNAIYIIIITGIVMGVAGVFLSKPILILMQTPTAIMEEAILYFRILCLGVVFVAGYNGVSGVLRALGDSITPLVFLLLSCVVNAALDVLFVVYLDMGVEGVGIATVIAQGVAMIGSILFALRKNEYLKLKKRHMKPSKTIVMQVASIGFPVALQNMMVAFSMVALQSVVNRFGAAAMAAYTATSRVEQLTGQPFASMGSAISTFTGQNLGANRTDRVKRGYGKSVWTVGIFGLFMLLMVSIFGRWIIGQFVSDPQVIQIGVTALRITGPFYIMLGMIHVTRGVLNGAGDGTFALAIGIVEIAGRIGLSLLFAAISGIGVWSVWWTTGVTWTLVALYAIFRYRQGHWKKLKQMQT